MSNDYPKYKFKCGCVFNYPEGRAIMDASIKRGRKVVCPEHDGEKLDVKIWLCPICGVEFEANPVGGTRENRKRYCKKCQKVRNRMAVDAYRARQKAAYTAIRGAFESTAATDYQPVIRQPPPIIGNNPEIHPCLQCQIGIDGLDKSTNVTCHYCQHRIDWCYRQELKCIGY